MSAMNFGFGGGNSDWEFPYWQQNRQLPDLPDDRLWVPKEGWFALEVMAQTMRSQLYSSDAEHWRDQHGFTWRIAEMEVKHAHNAAEYLKRKHAPYFNGCRSSDYTEAIFEAAPVVLALRARAREDPTKLSLEAQDKKWREWMERKKREKYERSAP